MTQPINPADAVREAPTELERIIAEMMDVFSRASADFTHDELAAKIAKWADRLAALAGAAPVAHGSKDHGIEASSRETFVPCDCGCGRSCCAMCGNDVGFLTHAPAKAREVTDQDVERAARAYLSDAGLDPDEPKSPALTSAIRAALATFTEGAE